MEREKELVEQLGKLVRKMRFDASFDRMDNLYERANAIEDAARAIENIVTACSYTLDLRNAPRGMGNIDGRGLETSTKAQSVSLFSTAYNSLGSLFSVSTLRGEC